MSRHESDAKCDDAWIARACKRREGKDRRICEKKRQKARGESE
jgi:hypothetical protein